MDKLNIQNIKNDIEEAFIFFWVCDQIDIFRINRPEKAEKWEREIFDDSTLEKLFKSASPDVLDKLFAFLPEERFIPFYDVIASKWISWPDRAQSLALWSFIHQSPTKAEMLLEQLLHEYVNYGNFIAGAKLFPGLLGIGPDLGLDIALRLFKFFDEKEEGSIDEIFLPFVVALSNLYDLPVWQQKFTKQFVRADVSEKAISNLIRAATAPLKMRGYLYIWALDSANRATECKFSDLPLLFKPDAPLDRLDQLSEAGSKQGLTPLLELAEEYNCDLSSVKRVFEIAYDKADLSAKKNVAAILCAVITTSISPDKIDWTQTDLQTAIEYLSADIIDVPDKKGLSDHILTFERKDVIEGLITELDVRREYIGRYRIAGVMGDSGFPEFIEPLLNVLDQDDDHLNDEVMKTLGRFGVAAEEAILQRWDAMSDSQKIYSLGTLEICGGEKTLKFILDGIAQKSDLDIGAWAEIAARFPCVEIYGAVSSLLPTDDLDVREVFLVLCKLLEMEHPDFEQLKLKWYERQREIAERGENFFHDDYDIDDDEYIYVELTCSECGASDAYEVENIFISTKAADKTPYIAEEIICSSCGKLAEFTPTESGSERIFEEVARFEQYQENLDEYHGPIFYVDSCFTDGRTASIPQVLQHYKDRLAENSSSVVDLISLANCYRNSDQLTFAMGYFERAYEIDPRYVEAGHAIAGLYYEKGLFNKSLYIITDILFRRDEWLFCRLVNASEHDFHVEVVKQYNELISILKIDTPPKPIPPKVISLKVGRNDPCPCGSGKKYKKCCLR